MPKTKTVHTLHSAEQRLPYVESCLVEGRAKRLEAETVAANVQFLKREFPDQDAVRVRIALRKAREKLDRHIQGIVEIEEELETIGVTVHKWDPPIASFDSRIAGKPAFLLWRLGEKCPHTGRLKVKWWIRPGGTWEARHSLYPT